MTCSWRWFIHPETAISKNRNGSSTLCAFKTHYLDRRAAVAKYRIFMQIQFSDHMPSGSESDVSSAGPPLLQRSWWANGPASSVAKHRSRSPYRVDELLLARHCGRTNGIKFRVVSYAGEQRIGVQRGVRAVVPVDGAAQHLQRRGGLATIGKMAREEIIDLGVIVNRNSGGECDHLRRRLVLHTSQ